MPMKSPRRQQPSNIRWVIFTLAFGTSWMMYLHRYIFALIKPRLAEEWNLDKEQLGLFDSAFSLTYMIFQFPLGIAADAIGVHIVLTVLLLIWCAGLAMHAWAPSPKYMWYARALLGVGQSAVYANLNRIARVWFPMSIRTTLQGLVGVLAGRIGGLSAYLLFGTIMLGMWGWDWRTAIYFCSAAGLLYAIIFFVVFRNSPRAHPHCNKEEVALLKTGVSAAISTSEAGGLSTVSAPKTSPKLTIRQLLRSMKPRAIVNLFCLNIQTILSTFADNIYSNWIPLFLFEVHALKFKEMGIYSSLPLLGGAIAGLAGGLLNDFFIGLTGNRRWSRSGVAFCGKGMAALLLFLAMVWYDSPYVFCGFLFFVKFFGDWSLTTSWGVVTDIGGRATASVFAFNNAVATIGAIAAPVIYGIIAERLGWRVVFMTAASTYVLCALSWLLINSTIPILVEVDEDSSNA